MVEFRQGQVVFNKHHRRRQEKRPEKRGALQIGPRARQRLQSVESPGVRIMRGVEHVEGHGPACTKVQVDEFLGRLLLLEEALGREVGKAAPREVAMRVNQADAAALVQMLQKQALQELGLARAR